MDDIQGIIAQMTLEEKAALVTGATTWTTTPIERLGVPETLMTDGPHGVRKTYDVNSISSGTAPATAFPTLSSLACTWDVELAAEIGRAIAQECIALNVDIILGPGVNIKRTPLCGRNFEYFSEDPFLAGSLATAFVNGVQSQGVGTSLKHFAANNQESARFKVNAEIDERTLREIYLPAFEMTVKQAQPWTIMCAYNRLNGDYCSENYRLLTEILKEEWGFEGFVVSDWGAVHDRVAALKGGLDLEMPGPRPRRTQAVIDAVQAGELDEAVLNESVRRILRVVGMTEKRAPSGDQKIEEHHALARRAAAEGIVLLKNNGVLPIKQVEHIAVIGRAARVAQFQGGGSSHINPTRLDTPLAEVRALAPDAEVSFCEGYLAGEGTDAALIQEAVSLAAQAEVALIYVALPSSKESEGYDRPDLFLLDQQVELIKAVCKIQPNTVVILNNSSALDMRAWIDDAGAVVEAWMGGQATGGAMADVLFGRVNPSGKLAESFAQRLEDTPAWINFPGENGTVRYGEGIYVGYRYYDARDLAVAFPFGHGLSYTTFAYSNLRVSSPTFNDVDGATVTFDVTNTGSMAGKEIAQVYVADKVASVGRPPKELKGFGVVRLEAGETKSITVTLDYRSFAFYQPALAEWVAEAGEFEILVGASSRDIRLQGTVTLVSTMQRPSTLQLDSTVAEWLADAKGAAVAGPMLEEIKQGMLAAFGGSETAESPADDASVGMDMTGFIMEMPLLSLLQFNEANLPVPAEEIVAGLIAQTKA